MKKIVIIKQSEQNKVSQKKKGIKHKLQNRRKIEPNSIKNH